MTVLKLNSYEEEESSGTVRGPFFTPLGPHAGDLDIVADSLGPGKNTSIYNRRLNLAARMDQDIRKRRERKLAPRRLDSDGSLELGASWKGTEKARVEIRPLKDVKIPRKLEITMYLVKSWKDLALDTMYFPMPEHTMLGKSHPHQSDHSLLGLNLSSLYLRQPLEAISWTCYFSSLAH